jgi:hypothetical protein
VAAPSVVAGKVASIAKGAIHAKRRACSCRPTRRRHRSSFETFDDVLGRRIIGMHVWAVRDELCGAVACVLFDGFCQRLVIDGVPLWHAYAAMETLHPQWSAYGYTWRRDSDRAMAGHPPKAGLLLNAGAAANTPGGKILR